MKSDHILYSAVGGGVVGLAWVASSHSFGISFEQVIGYGTVAALLAIGALDYRIGLKKFFR